MRDNTKEWEKWYNELSQRHEKANQIQQIIADLNQSISEAVDLGLEVDIYYHCGDSIASNHVGFEIRTKTIYCQG